MCFLCTKKKRGLVGSLLIIIMTEDNSVNEIIGCRLDEPGFSLSNDNKTVFKALPVDDNGSKVAGVSK